MQGMTQDPTLDDFFHDMNEHGMTNYSKVGERTVLELERAPSDRWALTVWQAVTEDGDYVVPAVDGNRYHWDAIGRGWFEDYDAGEEALQALTSEADVREFCEENPYDGPRTPWAERE